MQVVAWTGLLEAVDYNRQDQCFSRVGITVIVFFNSKSFPSLLGCSLRRYAKIWSCYIPRLSLN